MPLSGTTITFSYASDAGGAGGKDSLLHKIIASQTITGSAVTSIVAPQPSPGKPIVTIYTTVDIYYSIGPAPDATQAVSTNTSTARASLPAGASVDRVCDPDDKVAVVVA